MSATFAAAALSVMTGLSSLLPIPAQQATTVDTIKAGDTFLITTSTILGSGVPETSKCSMGPIIDNDLAFTASHCGPVGSTVLNEHGEPIGTVTSFINGRDIATIAFLPTVTAEPTRINDDWAPVDGVKEKVSKVGATTGHSEGTTTGMGGFYDAPIAGDTILGKTPLGKLIPPALDPTEWTRQMWTTSGFMATLCTEPGDSGAAVFNSKGEAVGVVSGSAGDCDESVAGSGNTFVANITGLDPR